MKTKFKGIAQKHNVTIDPTLNKYAEMDLFPKKRESALKTLQTIGLPKELQTKK